MLTFMGSMVEDKVRFYFKVLFRLLAFVGKAIGIILLANVIGVSILQLIFLEQWDPIALLYLLPLILMSEGAIIALAGILSYSGYSEYRLMRQAAINPQIARDSLRGWYKRRMSQRDWGIKVIIVGLLLFFIGLFLAGFLSI